MKRIMQEVFRLISRMIRSATPWAVSRFVRLEPPSHRHIPRTQRPNGPLLGAARPGAPEPVPVRVSSEAQEQMRALAIRWARRSGR